MTTAVAFLFPSMSMATLLIPSVIAEAMSKVPRSARRELSALEDDAVDLDVDSLQPGAGAVLEADEVLCPWQVGEVLVVWEGAGRSDRDERELAGDGVADRRRWRGARRWRRGRRSSSPGRRPGRSCRR